MFKYIRTTISNTKKSLFTFNSEPFSKFSIFLIILLDIFLLVTILSGIHSEKNMAPNIYTKYPTECVKHFDKSRKTKIWDNTTNRYLYTVDSFPFKEYNSFRTFNNYGYYSSKNINVRDDQRISAVCRELNQKIYTFTKDRTFINNKKLLVKLKNDKRNVFAKINKIEARYNTSIFEKTAELNGNLINTRKKYYELLDDEKGIDLQIKNIKKVTSYKGYNEYVAFVKENRKQFKEDIKSYRFWQPFIAFLYLLKFSLPLLLLSFIGYKYANRINREQSTPIKLLKLVSGHIVFITIIPIFFNIMYLIYHIIPHRFFKEIIEFLYKFGFIFLGYYFLMFVGIALFGFVIFLIQKNVAKREKLKKEFKDSRLFIDSFNKDMCPNCKNKVSYIKQNYCGFCSEKLNRECKSCGKDTPKNIDYCIYCGKD